MIRPFAALFERLDAAYRGRSHFVAQKARLLAIILLLALGVFIPVNIGKLLLFPPPVELAPRLVANAILAIITLVALRSLLAGRLERAAGGFAIAVIAIIHGLVLVFPDADYVEPLAMAIQVYGATSCSCCSRSSSPRGASRSSCCASSWPATRRFTCGLFT